MKLSSDIINHAISHRRHLHAHPELSGNEEQTAEYIHSCLDRWGVPYEKNIGGLGIVAWIGPEATECIALRADMDALPIHEANTTSYQSKNHGIMHACGHDVHMACLLGAIEALQTEHTLSKRVYFIFQPHEEVLPGGAQLMIDEGLFERFPIAKLVGLHVSPELEAGVIGHCSGPFMAASDEIRVTFESKGGHAARPHLTGDTIAMGANFIIQAQQIVSRLSNPIDPILFTIGVFDGKGATNIIPSTVILEGTLRTMNEAHRQAMHQKLEKLAEQIASFNQGKASLEIRHGYPVLQNDAAVTQDAVQALKSNDVSCQKIPMRMTSEDFARYGQYGKPLTFLRLGTGNPNNSGLHRPDFDINEDAIAHGVRTLVILARTLH